MGKNYSSFEQRKSSLKWRNIDEARQGVVGSSQNIERVAKARMKAQEVFENIRLGKA